MGLWWRAVRYPFCVMRPRPKKAQLAVSGTDHAKISLRDRRNGQMYHKPAPDHVEAKDRDLGRRTRTSGIITRDLAD